MVKSKSEAVLVGESKIDRFLNSVERNSIQSKKAYSTALIHFHAFLSNDGRYTKFSEETIVDALLKNQINVYSLLDDFISYLISRHGQNYHLIVFYYMWLVFVLTYFIRILISFRLNLRGVLNCPRTTGKMKNLSMHQILEKYYYRVIT